MLLPAYNDLMFADYLTNLEFEGSGLSVPKICIIHFHTTLFATGVKCLCHQNRGTMC